MNQAKLNPSLLKSKCLASFPFYCAWVQDPEYFEPLHVDLCKFLQSILSLSSKRGLVILPRGSYKTTIATQRFAEWLAIRDPNIRILIVSNTQPNASRVLRGIRNTFTQNDNFRALFHDLIPNIRKVRWNDAAVEIKRTRPSRAATFEAAGVDSQITGRHFDVIIEDDTSAPHLDELHLEANEVILPDSETIRKAIAWNAQAFPLLVDPSNDIRLVVGTRWMHGDLMDVLIQRGRYKVYDRPAVEDGKPIMRKFTPEALAELEETLGPYLFSALYMNSPMRPEQMAFQPSDIIYVTTPPPEEAHYIITIDPAISKSEEACETAIIRAAHYSSFIHVTHVVHSRFLPAEIIDRALDLVELDYEHTSWIGVEATAFQESLVYYFKDAMQKRRLPVAIQAIKPRRKKADRIYSLQPFFVNHQVLLSSRIDAALRDQLLQFPYGKAVDLLDALAMQVLSYVPEGNEEVSTASEESDRKKGFLPTVEELLARKGRMAGSLSPAGFPPVPSNLQPRLGIEAPLPGGWTG